MVTGFFPDFVMGEVCDLCRRRMLAQIYAPEGSTRGLKVYVCRHCGLVQSLPRIDRAPRSAMAASGGADWGNIRYGKAFRTQAALSALKRHTDLDRDLAILDVGSNRGSFVRALLDFAPRAKITAVEPDERVAGSCRDLDRTESIEARIEEVALETNRFEVVHSCHTIEHLAHPTKVLADHWRVLKPGGVLILDAPNIAFLDSDDIVEEWFIDKHLYHFSARTLLQMVRAAGFTIVAPPDPRDRENLLIVARKATGGRAEVTGDPEEAVQAERRVAAYAANRAGNLASLAFVAAEIAAMAPKRVAVWGAGRLFDSLVVHGGFDTAMLSHLIDKHLRPHLQERHGRTLESPSVLRTDAPDVVIAMSRGFVAEIVAEARELAPRAEIVTYSSLLSRAQLRKAA